MAFLKINDKLYLTANADTCVDEEEGHDLDKEMFTEKLIWNEPFDYTKLLEIAGSQSKPFI